MKIHKVGELPLKVLHVGTGMMAYTVAHTCHTPVILATCQEEVGRL
jgi:hypothetical protein